MKRGVGEGLAVVRKLGLEGWGDFVEGASAGDEVLVLLSVPGGFLLGKIKVNGREGGWNGRTNVVCVVGGSPGIVWDE